MIAEWRNEVVTVARTGRWPRQHGVYQVEPGGVQSDADSKRDHGDERAPDRGWALGLTHADITGARTLGRLFDREFDPLAFP